MTPRRVVSRIDRVGLALVASFILWVACLALISGRSPRGYLATILLSSVAYALGWASTRFVAAWLVPATVMILGCAVFVHSPTSTLSHLSAQGFLGYANAKAAFFVQAAFAAALIVASERTPAVAVLSIPTVAVFAMVPIHARSLGAFLSSLLLIPGLLVGAIGRLRRPAIVLAAIIALGGIGTSLGLAREFANHPVSVLSGRLADRVDRGRAAVWADSYRLFRDHPGLGVGPGGFAENSWAAFQEPDLRWAHNEFLQIGAETGLLGFALLMGLLGWVFWKLWSVGTAAAAVGALAVSSLAIHACAEYLLHFPLLPATTAALAGSASVLARRRDRSPASRSGKTR